MSIKTYQKEYLIVAIVLFIPVLINQSLIEIVAATAIFFTFQHHQVASRMQEKQSEKAPSVECNKKLNVYFAVKEILWITFFILSGAYSGIVGSIVFLIYPAWRKARMMIIMHKNL